MVTRNRSSHSGWKLVWGKVFWCLGMSSLHKTVKLVQTRVQQAKLRHEMVTSGWPTFHLPAESNSLNPYQNCVKATLPTATKPAWKRGKHSRDPLKAACSFTVLVQRRWNGNKLQSHAEETDEVPLKLYPGRNPSTVHAHYNNVKILNSKFDVNSKMQAWEEVGAKRRGNFI